MNAPADDGATRTGVHGRDDLPPGSVLGGRFRIEQLLGVGGMGVVYRATDLTLGVAVAIKLLRLELAQREETFDRFRQELLLARQVSSPRVVRIHDLAQLDGRWLIGMDFVDGEPLDRRIDRDGPLPVAAAAAIAADIAEGLAAAHATGVIHRDLKPANILIDREGRALIADFGVARSLASAGLTRAGAVVGTPDYLSPEQARGEAADARSDLYALGLILHEMLAGTLPFPGGTLAEVLAQRMLRAPTPVRGARPDTPDWLAQLISRLLRATPAHRPQSATTVADALRRGALPGEPLHLRLRSALARRSGRLALAATLALAAAGVGWWAWPTREAAPAGAQTVAAPLQRLLVAPLRPLPGAAVDAPDAAQLAALGERLRASLAAAPGLVVVDRDRSRQALRQADPAGQAMPDADALRRLAAANDVLLPQLRQADGRWRIDAQHVPARGVAANLAGPWAETPDAALAAWLRAPATVQALGAKAALPVPDAASDGALRAFGEGLLARDAGRLEDALAAFARAGAAAPGLVAAWEAQAQVALDIGARDRAADAIVQAQRAAARAPAVLRQRLDAQRAAIDGDAEAAVAAWAARVAAAPDDLDAALHLARAEAAAGRFDPARTRLTALTARDPGDPRLWFERGKLAILQGDARSAVDEHLVRALVAFKRGGDRYGEAETVNALGVGYGRLGQTADAIQQYRQAIPLRRALGNRRGEATSQRNLANLLALTGDFDGADAALREARRLNIALGDRAAHAGVDNELGLLAEERGDFPAALDAFRRALAIWQQDGDAHGAAEALNNIGFAHFQLGSYDDAQVYWQQAADAYAALGERTGQVRTGQNLGLLAAARGRWREARTTLQRALATAERRQMVEEAAVSRRNLAELALLQGQLGEALAQAGRAEAAFRQREDQRGLSDVGLLRVEALLAAHDDAQAGQVLTALAPALEGASREQQAIAALLAATLAERGGRPDPAALQRAQTLAQASGVRQLQLRIALFAAGDAPAALAALDAPTAALGHTGLRLEWLLRRLRAALAAGDTRAALTAYEEAAATLRAGEALPAEALHRLGAETRRRAGDTSGARLAETRADEALEALRRGLPPAARAGFEAALADRRASP